MPCVFGMHSTQVHLLPSSDSLVNYVHLALYCVWMCVVASKRVCVRVCMCVIMRKQLLSPCAQVCYSWWCLSCLSILGRLHWIDQKALTKFILGCQVGKSCFVPKFMC